MNAVHRFALGARSPWTRQRFLLGVGATLGLAIATSAQTTLHTIVDSPGLFGQSVRSAGDVDLDGVPDVLAGVPGGGIEYCSPAAGGWVGVYSGRTGVRLYQIFAPPNSIDLMGWSVASIADLNGDGRPDLIVGAPHWPGGLQCGKGQVRIYSGADGSLLHTLVGTGGLPSGYELFGISVANAGDVNADGTQDVLVGATYGQNHNGDGAGYARIFSGADWSTIHTVYGNVASERFGQSVSGVGDVNLDGFADFAVGTPFSTYAGGCGSVRVYSGADGLILHFFNGQPGCIGRWVAAAGDVDADGVPDIASSGGAGAVVFSGSTGAVLMNVSGSSGAVHSVDGAGDVNQDGHADLIVARLTSARVYSGFDGSILYGYAGPVNHVPSVAAAGDVNSDGLADVLVAWPGLSQVKVQLSGCPVPTTYCSAKLNSIGCLPAIGFSGVPSLTMGVDDFRVAATNVRSHQLGMLIWGKAQTSAPFGGGTRCVGKPFRRTQLQDSGGPVGLVDCNGYYSFHFSQAFMTANGLQAGDVVYGQYWSRDPGYSPPNDIGLTNAVTFTVLP